MGYVNYLDWYDLFVNRIAGSETVFIFLSFIVIGYVCAKYRFNNSTTLTVFATYCVLMSVAIQNLLPIVLLIVGLLFGWTISRLFSRG